MLMPVARYFLFVGGILLALILAIDGFSSPQAVVASQAASSVDKTVVRILRPEAARAGGFRYQPSDYRSGAGCGGASCCATRAGLGRCGRHGFQRPGPSARYLCPVRPSRGKEARAAGPAQAQDRQEPPGTADAVRATAATAGRAAVAFRLLRWLQLEQHLVRCVAWSVSAAVSESCRQIHCSKSTARLPPSGSGSH